MMTRCLSPFLPNEIVVYIIQFVPTWKYSELRSLSRLWEVSIPSCRGTHYANAYTPLAVLEFGIRSTYNSGAVIKDAINKFYAEHCVVSVFVREFEGDRNNAIIEYVSSLEQMLMTYLAPGETISLDDIIGDDDDAEDLCCAVCDQSLVMGGYPVCDFPDCVTEHTYYSHQSCFAMWVLHHVEKARRLLVKVYEERLSIHNPGIVVAPHDASIALEEYLGCFEPASWTTHDAFWDLRHPWVPTYARPRIAE